MPADATWFAPGRTLCMAVDLDEGTVRLATDGGAWADAVNCVRPGGDTGAGVYPFLCGNQGVRVRCHFGREPRQEMRVAPPSGDYRWIWDGREQVGAETFYGGGNRGERG